jgi:hypothetical protein
MKESQIDRTQIPSAHHSSLAVAVRCDLGREAPSQLSHKTSTMRTSKTDLSLSKRKRKWETTISTKAPNPLPPPMQAAVLQLPPMIHTLRNGKTFSSQTTSKPPSQPPPKRRRITPPKKSQANIPSKKPAKPVSGGGKRRPTLTATVNAAVPGPVTGPCACKTCSNVIAVETFAQRWVDENGQQVKLEMAERVEISDILKMAPARVVKVQRIYNKALERRYMAKREELRRLGQGEQVLAFHSTAPWNIVPYLCSANSGADV